MDARFDALLAALTRVEDPFDILRLPAPGVLPSPWETWTLIGLARHRGRQFWVADLVRTRLRGVPRDLAAVGALGHPEVVPQLGPVPGMPVWEYYFHGRGCRVTHKVDGDSIDVDFYGDTAEYFDTYFYTNYLGSLRRPEPPEQRLRELNPSARTSSLAIASLLAAGALTPLEGRDARPFRLADEVVDSLDAIDAFCEAWADPGRRHRLAALIGDWLAADGAAPADQTAVTAPRAERCRELWQQRLRRDLKVLFNGADALQALADLNAPDLDRDLEDALRGPPSGIVSAALAVIGKADDPKWCDPVYSLFSRTDPSGQAPQPHVWMTSLKFLLRHGYRMPEMISALSKAGRTEVGEAVLLSLEHAPDLALPLIRIGLLSDVPTDRAEVAAILALLDKPWSAQELLRALKASDDQEKTADARAALLETGDPQAERAVLEWEELNPHENETPFHSMGEHVLKNRGAYLRYEMDRLHDRVLKLKHVVPPDPPNP